MSCFLFSVSTNDAPVRETNDAPGSVAPERVVELAPGTNAIPIRKGSVSVGTLGVSTLSLFG